MHMFLCRWPNGEFSIVKARDREEALEEIWMDGADNADGVPIFLLRSCILHGRVSEEGELEIYAFGEDTDEEILSKAYPRLHTALEEAEVEEKSLDYTKRGRERIQLALEEERSRIKLRKTREPTDTFTRSYRRYWNMPTSMAEKYRKEGLEGAAEIAVKQVSSEDRNEEN